jgi:hypothetical protein
LCTGKIDADELRHIFVTLGDALTQVRVCTKKLKNSLIFGGSVDAGARVYKKIKIK